jgi:hypothetical protein
MEVFGSKRGGAPFSHCPRWKQQRNANSFDIHSSFISAAHSWRLLVAEHPSESPPPTLSRRSSALHSLPFTRSSMLRFNKSLCAVLILIAAAISSPLLAQISTSSLTGLVTDPSGSSVAHAHVNVLNKSTGFTRGSEQRVLQCQRRRPITRCRKGPPRLLSCCRRSE